MSGRKKLIEVALPLEAINREAAREKSIRHGHPSTLHLWWARRPLAACRAVLWASLVDDPSSHPESFPTEEAQETERQRLFRILEQLVLWENSTNERVLAEARAEILKSTDGHPPPVYDPFCGGGSIPLEAQRLGLEAHASDLNPVAVLITKALIEIPPKFAGRPPVHPDQDRTVLERTWKGAQGLAEDVRYYGKWMRDEAFRRIGHLYPKVRLPKEHGGGEATVIAWLWARTVRCPNPACGAEMPLVRSFVLSTKKDNEVWVEPIIDRKEKTVSFEMRSGKPASLGGTKVGRGANFRCLVCGEAAPDEHIKNSGMAKQIGTRLLAIVAEGERRRTYLSPASHADEAATHVAPGWVPEGELGYDPRAIWCVQYGLRTFSDLFTSRQLVAVTTFSDLATEARLRILEAAKQATFPLDERPLADKGTGPEAYADALSVYLALSLDSMLDDLTTIVTWRSGHGTGATRSTFARQGIPMTWDFAEANPFAAAAGDLLTAADAVALVLEAWQPGPEGTGDQRDAVDAPPQPGMYCTDPPYYDNIGYADLSDFFYVWLRRILFPVYPSLFSTLLVPKQRELVASPYRFEGSRKRAEEFFEQRLQQAFGRIRSAQDQNYPFTVFYAFRQAETDNGDGDTVNGTSSTGWQTLLEGLLSAGFSVSGTWPMRTERASRSISIGTNSLASSIVLVCRPRAKTSPLATRKEFLISLHRELPAALRHLRNGNVAPVDLAQAAIGPGMAVYSRYSKVIEADGSRLPVRTALQLINQVLDEVLAEQDSEFDVDTRWALAWFDQYGMEEGPYGIAEVLSKAKDTSIRGLEDSGALEARRGKVRLLRREELTTAWDPSSDRRLTVWEVAQHLILRLEQDGEAGAAALLAKLGALGETARDLAYRLYTVCERRGWAKEAISYNALVLAWPEISRLAQTGQAAMQPQLFR